MRYCATPALQILSSSRVYEIILYYVRHHLFLCGEATKHSDVPTRFLSQRRVRRSVFLSKLVGNEGGNLNIKSYSTAEALRAQGDPDGGTIYG